MPTLPAPTHARLSDNFENFFLTNSKKWLALHMLKSTISVAVIYINPVFEYCLLHYSLFVLSCYKQSVFRLKHCICKQSWFLWICHVVDNSSSFINLPCRFAKTSKYKLLVWQTCTSRGCKTDTRQKQIYFDLHENFSLQIWEQWPL